MNTKLGRELAVGDTFRHQYGYMTYGIVVFKTARPFLGGRTAYVAVTDPKGDLDGRGILATIVDDDAYEVVPS